MSRYRIKDKTMAPIKMMGRLHAVASGDSLGARSQANKTKSAIKQIMVTKILKIVAPAIKRRVLVFLLILCFPL
jgi:hypothetical protein